MRTASAFATPGREVSSRVGSRFLDPPLLMVLSEVVRRDAFASRLAQVSSD